MMGNPMRKYALTPNDKLRGAVLLNPADLPADIILERQNWHGLDDIAPHQTSSILRIWNTVDGHIIIPQPTDMYPIKNIAAAAVRHKHKNPDSRVILFLDNLNLFILVGGLATKHEIISLWEKNNPYRNLQSQFRITAKPPRM